MANNSTQLTPDVVKTVSELTNVRRISDLNIINVYENDGEHITASENFNNSYLLSSTYLGDRYYNYRVKLNEITQYIRTLGHNDIEELKNIFDYFIGTLVHNTNADNSYVQLQFAYADTQPKLIDNYAYTFKYVLSQIQSNNHKGFSYNDDGDESSYAFTNELTPGLVTSYVLEQYVRDTLGRVLGVPATEAAVSNAIDSVIEFVEWFKDYGKNEEGLRALITRIDNKDAEIINSYQAADAAINTRIDDLDFSQEPVSKKYMTGITQVDGRITSVSTKQITTSEISGLDTALENAQLNPGTNVTITNKRINSYVSINQDKKKIQIGNISYILSFDDTTGKLSLDVDVDNYSRITLSNITSSVTKYVEYKSSTTASQISLSAKTSKPCQATQWNATSPATVTNQSNTASSGKVTYTATGKYGAIYNGTGTQSYSWTINATEILTADDIAHGHTAQDAGTKTVSMTYNFTYYAYWTAISATKTDDLNSLTLNKGAISSNGYPAKAYFSSSNWGNGAYIYFLIKGTGSHTFVMGSGTADGTMAGGIVRVGNAGDYTRYSDIPYTLYRSDAIQTGNCNVKIS